MSDQNNIEIQSNIDIDNQAEIITSTEGVSYLSPELISGGHVRNIVTVKLTTAAGNSFCVDVLKQNPLYRILNSEYQEQLLKMKDDADSGETAKLSIFATYESLVETIVKPQLSIKDDQLVIGHETIPGDVVDLLLEAIDIVNNRRQMMQAVQSFQEDDGSEQR